MSPLKVKIIKEYQKMVKELAVGHQFNYDYILDMINFTEVGSHTNNPEFLQNHFLAR